MWSFQYKHGDRPLDGYTIERAAGRGGFGEVYYARSDSGREVALKVVTGYEQIELRGIGQCMNLKSPHLVSIFDVRHNDQGKPFVIMEFVSGPSLRQLLDEAPGGLGEQKCAFFLREIAKGLQYLHECGIVHRDLKPGNIFYENGYVKIGDYGLSKAIATSQHQSQTVQVGTVHYMAPEIGMGKYDRSIDIYALGALLYEMLTGMVPYVGASATEVLMKHLSSEPDCKGISEPFASVVKKAMAKDPAQRYQTVQDMVEGIFGAEHVRQSVSVFSPDSLTMVAGRIGGKVAVGAGVGGPGSGGSSGPTGAPEYQHDVWQKVGSWVDQVADMGRRGRFGKQAVGATPAISINDPMQSRHRVILAGAIVFLSAIAAMLFAQKTGRDPMTLFWFAVLSLIGIGVSTVLEQRVLAPIMLRESKGVRRLFGGLLMTMVAALLTLPTLATSGFLVPTLIGVIATLFITDCGKLTKPERKERVDFLGPALGAFIVAAIAASIFGGSGSLAGSVAAGASVVIQLLSPWDPTLKKRRLEAGLNADDLGPVPPVPPMPGGKVTFTASTDDGFRVETPAGVVYKSDRTRYRFTEISNRVRMLWLAPFVLGMTAGIVLLIVAGTTRLRDDEFAACVTFGVSGLFLQLMCITRLGAKRFYGWWNYLLRPILWWASVTSIVGCSVVLGNMHLSADEHIPCVIGIVLPSVLLLTSLFLNGKSKQISATNSAPVPDSHFRRSWATLLASIFFFSGLGGLHRFYVGRTVSGVIWILTGGFFVVGQVIDLIMILTGHFKDAEGRPVKIWESESLGLKSGQGSAPIPPPIPQSPIPPSPSAVEIGALGGRIGQVVGDAMKSVGSGVQIAIADARNAARSAREMSQRYRPRRGGLMAAFAAMLLFISSIVALGVAIDVPGMIDAGFPDKTWKHEINNAFRTNIAGLDEIPLPGTISSSRVVVLGSMRTDTRTYGEGAFFDDSSQAAGTSVSESRIEVGSLAATQSGTIAPATGNFTFGTGVFDERFGHQFPDTASLRPQLNYEPSRWVPLVRSGGILVSAVFGVLGLTLLVFARRDAGVTHLLRAMLGTGCLCAAFIVLHATLNAQQLWAKHAGRDPGDALEAFITAFSDKRLINFLAAFFVAILMLSWPPKKEVLA